MMWLLKTRFSANYHRSTDEEKNIFWLKELNKPYCQISFENRIKMNHSAKGGSTILLNWLNPI